jgi:hypothetical protein
MTQPLLPLSHVARFATASHRSKKYLSQSGLDSSVTNLYLP